MKEYQEKIKEYDKLIEQNKNDVDAYFDRGFAKRNLGDYDGAIKDFINVTELKPNHYQAFCNIGFTKLKLNEYKEALLYSNKAIKVNTHYALAFYIRGFANKELMYYEDAMEDFQKVLTSTDYFQNENVKSNLVFCISAILKKKTYNNNNVEINNNRKNSTLIKLLLENIKKIDKDKSPYYYLLKLLKDSGINFNSNIANKTTTDYRNVLKEKYLFGTAKEVWHKNKILNYSLNHKIGFGKYEKQTLNQIIAKDPQYIIWCILNLVHFSVNCSLLVKHEFQIFDNYLLAVEINLFKLDLIKLWNCEIEENKLKIENDFYSKYGTENINWADQLEKKFTLSVNKDIEEHMSLHNWTTKNSHWMHQPYYLLQFQGDSLEDVFLQNPQLIIQWVLTEDYFIVEYEILENDYFKGDTNIQKALEINFIKMQIKNKFDDYLLSFHDNDNYEGRDFNEFNSNRDAFDDDEQYDSFMADRM